MKKIKLKAFKSSIIELFMGILLMVIGDMTISHRFYVGGIADNSCLILSGAFSSLYVPLIGIGCLLAGYSIKGILSFLDSADSPSADVEEKP